MGSDNMKYYLLDLFKYDKTCSALTLRILHHGDGFVRVKKVLA